MSKFTVDPTDTTFTQVLNRVMFDTTLSMGARLLYAALVEHYRPGSPTRPGQERLASMVGCSTRSIRNYLKELVTRGLVTVLKRGCWQNANEYQLNALVPSQHAQERQPREDRDMRKVVSRDTMQSRSYQVYKPNNNYKYSQKRTGESGAVAFMRRHGLISG